MARYDAANRLSVPHDGLDGEPEILWTAELEGNVEPPVVYDDTAFVGHDRGTYSAVDLTADGEIRWEHDSDGPRVAPAVSDTAVFVGGDGVEALTHDDGEVLWTTGHDESVESLRIYDDTVYAGIDNRVIALDENGDESLEIGTPATVQSLAIDEERIYVRSRPDPDEDEFVMTAYDRDSGEHFWKHEVTHAQQRADDRVTRTFPIIDGKAFTLDSETLITIEGNNGEIVDVVNLDKSSWTRPSIHNNTAYFQRGSMAYDIETGMIPTEWDPETSADTPVIFTETNSYSISSAGVLEPHKLRSLDPITGEQNWEKQAPERTNYHVPLVLNGMILIPEDNHGIIAYI
ncbi:PQQ-binding-like beta-propeller repeat protein [Halomontanus rarus]|uniref:outer membrane protein assembly factor BamB family protein n=1 Tax=Halomontanus rarus TaxID=3034020 RepID=UPI0023E8D175|nr:PQQ-binding-like beta-propeller repeat protein [Halovivax sp. TS33]